MMLRGLLLSVVGVIVIGCGDDDATSMDAGFDAFVPDTGDAGVEDAGSDSGVDAGPPCEGPPGLYADPGCEVLADDVLPYNPQFWLWSDGSDKERFIAFPPGTTIDTRDVDAWVFPAGTRIWKNFLIDGVKLETRYFEKAREGEGIGAWQVRTFQWTESQDTVFEVTTGATDVLGTDHDIPAVSLCGQCHEGGGQPDIVLGFGSLQLNHDDTEVSLADLDAMGLISNPVPAAMAVIPTSDPTTREALGYLHANCGHCHGGFVPRAGLDLFVTSGLSTVEETGVYLSAIDQPSTWIGAGATLRVVPGDPDASTLALRMTMRDGAANQMPPLATDAVDDVGLAAVREWILSLPTE